MNKLVPIGLGAAAVVVTALRRHPVFGPPERLARRPAAPSPAASRRADATPRRDRRRVACRIRSAADPEFTSALHGYSVVPRGMDRSSGDRALDGGHFPLSH